MTGDGASCGSTLVERDDALPVGLLGRPRPGVAGGDRGLQRVGAGAVAERLGSRQRRETAADQQLIPQRPVLIQEQDRLSRRADARPRARRLDLHQRDEPVHFRFVRHQLGQDAPEPQRFIAERRPHPVVARGRRIAFVEDQVDDVDDRGQPALRALRRAALRSAPASRPGSAWRGRSAARSSAPRRGTRARSPRSSGRRAAAASARRGRRSRARDGRP